MTRMNEMIQEKVLDIRNLSVEYPTPGRTVKAVRNISFDIYQREMLGLIGESGSGKTTVALASRGMALRMLPPSM